MTKDSMHIVIFEDHGWRDLLPLTTARAAFELRCGINTLDEKIVATGRAGSLRRTVRSTLAPVIRERHGDVAPMTGSQLWINGRLLCRTLPDMPCPGVCRLDDTLVAAHLPADMAANINPDWLLETAAISMLSSLLSGVPRVPFDPTWGRLIRHPWDLIAENPAELRRQIDSLPTQQAGRIDPGAHLLCPERIRIGRDTIIKPTAVLDATEGPIHVGNNVTISPHVCLRGPCSVGDGCLIQPGASIREGTAIGPVCKIGGEVEGTIIHGYSNKQHDGFLGHSYVGEWVNLGADTVTSDLKNTYGNVSVPLHGGPPIDTGLRFVGSIIGDHAKTAICTRLNTGTVLGFCCQIAAGRPPRYVPDFTWLTDDGAQPYDVEKAIATARTVMSRRKVTMSPAMEALFRACASAATGVTGTS